MTGLHVKAESDTPALQINNLDTGEATVRIYNNGRIEFFDGYDPDEAARTFWAALARQAPQAVAL